MTTFKELLCELPNGLHDAELVRFEVDYTRRELKLELDLWIGGTRNEAELYRRGLLTVEGLGFFVIQPPDPRYNWLDAEPVTIDAGDGIPSQAGNVSLPTPPADHSVSWIYMGAHNSFVLFSSRSAGLTWLGDPENHADSEE